MQPDDDLIEMMLSLALAYGSYVGAQWVHASGPFACVAAGVIQGSYGRQIGMSETTRRLLDDLWGSWALSPTPSSSSWLASQPTSPAWQHRRDQR